MKYLLDTNICIAVLKNCPVEVEQRLRQLPIGTAAISAVVLAELWHGVELSRKQKENQAALLDFLHYVPVLDWPKRAAAEYGKLRADLKRKGVPIGANDLLIVAHALAIDAVLVSDNTREFALIPGLRLENWIDRSS